MSRGTIGTIIVGAPKGAFIMRKLCISVESPHKFDRRSGDRKTAEHRFLRIFGMGLAVIIYWCVALVGTQGRVLLAQSYNVEVFGDVSSVGVADFNAPCLCRAQPTARPNVGKKSTQLVANRPTPILDLTFIRDQLGDDGMECFSIPDCDCAEDGLGSVEFVRGTLVLGDKKDGSAFALFAFAARGKDGATEIDYRLIMTGTFAEAENWPPAVGTTLTLTGWELEFGGGGGGKKKACKGEGVFSTTPLQRIVVTRPPAATGTGGGGSLSGVRFLRGDSNADGTIDISDSVFTLNYLFAGGPLSTCQDAADTNDDGSVDVADAVYALSFLFSGGARIPEPYPKVGVDPTPDGLMCRP